MPQRALSVRNRILLLLSLLATTFLAGALSWQSLERRQVDLLSRQARQDMVVTDQKELALKGESLKTLAFDYTYWDEMVSFVRMRNPKWASQNLETALSTYDTDGVWVYDTRMFPVYSVCSDNAKTLKTFPLALPALRDTLRKSHFCHFFVQTSQGLLEVRGATIHASSDVKRTRPAYGFFFTGRLWNRPYLDSLCELTGSRVSLSGPGTGQALDRTSETDGVFRFGQTFPGWHGQPVAQLHIVADHPGLRELNRSTGNALALFVAFAVLLLGLLSVCLLRWVSRPMQLIALSLQLQQPAILRPLKADRTEFGALAGLVESFFEQRIELLGEVQDRMRAEEALQRVHDALQFAHDQLEARVAERTSELAEANGALQRAYTATIKGWSRAMDLKDHETEGHCQRVTEMTLHLAEGLGFDEEQLLQVERGALLHDIGKMGIPDSILLKPGSLTDEEWVVMRQHPTFALEMLWPIDFLRPATDIPWCHHEKWDGSGYPRGLRGEEIPLAARIFAIVDVWDALRSDRPYREGWPLSRVCDHLRAQSGTHFDPGVVERFVELIAQGDGRPDDVRLAA